VTALENGLNIRSSEGEVVFF